MVPNKNITYACVFIEQKEKWRDKFETVGGHSSPLFIPLFKR